MFSGSLDAAVKDTFERLKFGGQTPHEQRVFYINLQEIKGIKFGTRNPVNYFDQFYNAELFLRAHGSYSIRIVDPLRFYAEAVPRNASRVEIEDINEQYMNEFLEGLQSSINQMGSRRHPHFVRSIQERRAVPATWQMRWMRAGGQCAAWRSSPWQSQAFPTMKIPRN